MLTSNSKVFKFLSQVRQEATKVTWPEKRELITSTIIVIIAVLLFSFVGLVVDYVIHNSVNFLLNIGK